MNSERKLIPIKFEDPSVSRKFSHEALSHELEFDLDYNNCETEVISLGKYIRGIIRISTKNTEEHLFTPKDMIYSINEIGEFVERERIDDELIDNWFYGRFEYTKSINGIDRYIFNQNICLYKYHHNKLHKLVSDLIYAELDKSRAADLKTKHSH